MSGVLPSSKWKLETGAYQALRPKNKGNLFLSVGSTDTTPYTVAGGLSPGTNFDADQGGSALNILGVSSHGSSGGFGLGSLFFFNRSRGTQASPTALQNGDPIGGLVFGGYGAGDYNLTISGVYATALDDWDVSQHMKLDWMISSASIFSTDSITGLTTASYPWSFNNTVGIADGTAAAPYFNFTSDTNTGIYSAAADQMGITVGGVDSVLIGNGATATPYIDISSTNRTITATQTLINYDPTIDVNYTNAGMPLGFAYSPTATFSQNGYAFGAGIGFYMHPLIQNSSGSTRTIGPFLGTAVQNRYQADGGSLTVNADFPFIAQSTFSRINSGALTVSLAGMFYSGGYTIGAGTTVTTFSDFLITEGSNSGTLTTHIGLNIPSLTAATNNTAILMGTATTGNWGIYQSTTVPNLFSGDINFIKEAARTVQIQDSTTANTVGAALSILSGKGKGTAAGGALNLTAGAADTAGIGGAVKITSGLGANLSKGGNIEILTGTGFTGGDVKIDVGGGFAGAKVLVGTVRNVPTGFIQATPTAWVHVGAGNANFSPLKLTTGTNLTTAEAGAFEYDNTLYFTQSDATRRNVVLATNATKTTAGAPYTNDGYITVRIGGTDVKLMTTA